MLKKILFSVLFLAFISGCSKNEPDIVFIAFNGSETPVETTQVNLVVGNTYGWIMYVDSPAPIKWKEEFILPTVPKEWDGGTAATNINVIEKTEEPLKGSGRYYIANMWDVDEGDPAGEYIFNIYVNDKKIKQFRATFKKM